MPRLSSALLALGLGLGLSFAGCGKHAAEDEAAPAAGADGIPVVTMDELSMSLAKESAVPVDCNGPQLRHDVGVIPGAVLLTDYEAFSLSELPAEKETSLVFYCANDQCEASHVAARRARSAGYARVHVLAAGIMGWAKAGHLVDKPALM